MLETIMKNVTVVASEMAQIATRRDIFRGNSYIEYTFHYILTRAIPPGASGEIGEAIQRVIVRDGQLPGSPGDWRRLPRKVAPRAITQASV